MEKQEKSVRNIFDFLEDNTVFDVKFALASLYLWLLFGFLSSMISCDIQKWMNMSFMFRHLIGIIAFFLLFTVISSKPNPALHIWKQTAFVYVIFLFMAKSKWYFALPTLILLVLDQTLKAQQDYLKSIVAESKEKQVELDNVTKYRSYFNRIIIIVIVIGCASYMYRQYIEHGINFSITEFFFSHRCRI